MASKIPTYDSKSSQAKAGKDKSLEKGESMTTKSGTVLVNVKSASPARQILASQLSPHDDTHLHVSQVETALIAVG